MHKKTKVTLGELWRILDESYFKFVTYFLKQKHRKINVGELLIAIELRTVTVIRLKALDRVTLFGISVSD